MQMYGREASRKENRWSTSVDSLKLKIQTPSQLVALSCYLLSNTARIRTFIVLPVVLVQF